MRAVQASGALQLLVLDPVRPEVRMASPSALSMLGCPASEIARLSRPKLLPDISERAWRRLCQRAADGRSPTFETRLARTDRTTFVANIRLTLLGGSGEELVLATIAGLDAGAEAHFRHRLDAALLSSVIETAPDAIITMNREGLIIDGFSPSAERIFGYSREEVIGRNVSILMPEPYRSRHDGYVAHYLETGEKRIIGIGRTVTARHKSGQVFPIELAVGEVKSGGVHLFTGFIRDISQRVAAQARVSKLQEELNHVARLSAMGEMASLIVHELNQPLTAIANFGEAAKRLVEAGDQPERAASFMEKSVAQAHRASEMIRRLRSFVTRGTSEMEPININETVREAARVALIGAADQHIRTRFGLADDLPAVMADRIQVQQVIINLIRNGIDAMMEAGLDACGDALLVVETARKGAGDVLVSVFDTGPGISDSVAANLFSPFTTTKIGGMGIGLSVSRSIVEAHGGRIWVEQPASGGTRFQFTLPVAQGASGP